MVPCSPLSLSRTLFLSLHVVLIPGPPLNKSLDSPREPPGRSPTPAPGRGTLCNKLLSSGADGAKLDPCLVWTLTRFAFPFPSKRARQRRGNTLPPAGRISCRSPSGSTKFTGILLFLLDSSNPGHLPFSITDAAELRQCISVGPLPAPGEGQRGSKPLPSVLPLSLAAGPGRPSRFTLWPRESREVRK